MSLANIISQGPSGEATPDSVVIDAAGAAPGIDLAETTPASVEVFNVREFIRDSNEPLLNPNFILAEVELLEITTSDPDRPRLRDLFEFDDFPLPEDPNQLEIGVAVQIVGGGSRFSQSSEPKTARP